MEPLAAVMTIGGSYISHRMVWHAVKTEGTAWDDFWMIAYPVLAIGARWAERASFWRCLATIEQPLAYATARATVAQTGGRMRWPINLLEDGSVVTADGACLGTWGTDETNVLYEFTPDSSSHVLLRHPFMRTLCDMIPEWHERSAGSAIGGTDEA